MGSQRKITIGIATVFVLLLCLVAYAGHVRDDVIPTRSSTVYKNFMTGSSSEKLLDGSDYRESAAKYLLGEDSGVAPYPEDEDV